MKYTLTLLLVIFIAELGAIAPPRVPGLSLPAEMIENIERDPGYYMPGVALSQRMQLYRQQVESAGRDASVLLDTVTGYVPVLCLQYSDVTAEWPVSQMENQLFDKNADWPTGSMTDYFEEVSYGAFSVTGDVYGWIPVSGDSEYYDRDNGHTHELITEGLAATDSSVDFSLYDNDGPDGLPNSGDDDGYVDQLVVIHSGTGGEYGGPEIWSHSWSLAAAGGVFTTNDVSASGGNIVVNGYVIQPAVDPQNQMEAIGVFCHEYGHALGLPDLYDRTPSGGGDSEGAGNWALMAGAGAEQSRPSHMCAWSKEMMGWITPVELQGNLYDLEIPAVVDTPVVYKLWTHGDIDPYNVYWGNFNGSAGLEYFLVENRQQKRFDDNLPGEGLLVWHIQNSVNSQNDDFTNKLVDLEAADNTFDMDEGRNRGDDGDPFPGISGNRYFDRLSRPASDVHGGGVSKVAVRNISDTGDFMYADLEVVANDLKYVGNVVDDYYGNGDGFANAGDSVRLTLEFLNLGSDISAFDFILSTDDPDITILDSTATYTGIIEDSSNWAASENFVFTVDPEASNHPIAFSVTGSDGAEHTEQYQITVMMENLYILVVDDSWGETDEHGVSIISYYEDAFQQAGIPYYHNWPLAQEGLPELSVLNSYRTLVWLTNSIQLTLTKDEQALLASYLDGGGSLLISGQNIGQDLIAFGDEQDSLFYAGYLRAEYVQDGPGTGSNILMTGIEHNLITSAYRPYFYISGGNSADNQASPDIISPINGAGAVMEFFGTGLMGKKSGIKYEGDYRLIYYSFGLEGINEQTPGNILRSDLLKRSIGWLQEDPLIVAVFDEKEISSPVGFTLQSNYPNPFNPVTNIVFSLDISSEVSVKVYSILGQEIASIFSGPLNPGMHSVSWNGTTHGGLAVPSGVYLYRVESDGKALTGKMMLLK